MQALSVYIQTEMKEAECCAPDEVIKATWLLKMLTVTNPLQRSWQAPGEQLAHQEEQVCQPTVEEGVDRRLEEEGERGKEEKPTSNGNTMTENFTRRRSTVPCLNPFYPILIAGTTINQTSAVVAIRSWINSMASALYLSK